MVHNEIKTEINSIDDEFQQTNKIYEMENCVIAEPEPKEIANDIIQPTMENSPKNFNDDSDTASDKSDDEKFEFVNSTTHAEEITEKKRLKNHLRVTQTALTKNYAAAKNNKSSSTSQRIRKFISDAEILKYYDLNCDRCFDYDKNEPLRFATSLENREHYKTVHKMINRCNGVCRVCSLSQTSKSKMREHIQRHENPSQYKCRICDRKFQFSYVLKYHELSHESDEIDTKYYVCDICGLKALTKSGLTKHMGVHQKSASTDGSSVSRVKKSLPKQRIGITCPICNKL